MSRSLAHELQRAAAEVPDVVFIRTREGDFTYAQMHDLAMRYQGALHGHGIRAGATVVLAMSNSAHQVAIWFALNGLRAVHAPVNTDLTGAGLSHALSVSDAQLVVVENSHDTRAFSSSSDRPVLEAQQLLADAQGGLGTLLAPTSGDDADIATLLFTSGTTGVSKACALSHRYLLRQGELHAKYFGLTSEDVLYCPFPLFHIDAATLTVSAALSVRGCAALGRRFSVSGFWTEARSFDATVFNFMGATLSLLWKQDPRDDDGDHRVRLAWGVPMPDWKVGFEDRFGLRLLQVYGSTDAGVPVYDPLDVPQRHGTAGRVIEEFELRIEPASSHGMDQAGVGEILVRGREPGLTMSRYFAMPRATTETVVDGWVHTGDLGSLDQDGFLTFHGRLSDSIRRRGENISAFEVEQLIASHPDVLEAAAIGVPSDLTEEDVMAFVVTRTAADISPDELHQYCVAHAPAYMAPRYIAVLDQLPKTPTQKIEKFKLKNLGAEAATYDAEIEIPVARPRS